jgi:5'-nucleotidase
LEHELRQIADVCVVAPAMEQSGVGHSITFLTPLTAKEVFQGSARRGWAVDGSPADSVKLGLFEFCPRRPDLVVSGINGGLNAGINILYSGTVAAAIEGAFFGLNSVAVSLEYDEQADYARAAKIARDLIVAILERKSAKPQLYNINIPTAAIRGPAEVRCVPMGIAQYGEQYEKRIDPRGRPYYWAVGGPLEKSAEETDLTALKAGFVTLTPLDFDLTKRRVLAEMEQWKFGQL